MIKKYMVNSLFPLLINLLVAFPFYFNNYFHKNTKYAAVANLKDSAKTIGQINKSNSLNFKTRWPAAADTVIDSSKVNKRLRII